MEITYKSRRIEKVCTLASEAEKKYGLEMAEKISELAQQINESVKIHIKIDTGMSRIGFQLNEESVIYIVLISRLMYIKLEGLYTHFAKADEEDKLYT